jgi:hypothetical protein
VPGWHVQVASAVFGAHGTVLTMPLDDLPDWLPAWCVDQLGDEPVSVLFELRQISAVFGLRLAGGRDVVVKAREDDGRAASCVAAQARLAERGFPCARPLTPVAGVGSLAVHAEEFRPGGEVLHGDSPNVAARYAEACSSWGSRAPSGTSSSWCIRSASITIVAQVTRSAVARSRAAAACTCCSNSAYSIRHTTLRLGRPRTARLPGIQMDKPARLRTRDPPA